MSILTGIIDDTLKRKDETGKLVWSRTSLTMFSAWVTALWAFIHYTIKDGFNEISFSIMVGVALGAKVTDAYSKKLDPTVQSASTQ